MTTESRKKASNIARGGAHRARADQGFTLVELMVAVTIGLIILAAVAQLFATSRATFGLEESMARVQENGRFAMEFLARDIRMAGYAGCSRNLSGTQVGNIVDLTTVAADAAVTFNPDGIQAFKYTGTSDTLGDWTPALPGDYFADGDVVPGTDVIIIQQASELNTHLTGNPTPRNDNIQILGTTAIAGTLAAGDILMVSDCKAADTFKATTVSPSGGIVTIAHSSSGNIGTPSFLTHPYGNEAELMKLVSRAYYIGNGSSTDANGPIPALFRKELVNGGSVQAQELVEGVQTMRLRYGEDTDGDGVANIYRNTPTAVGNWRNVVSVRIGILARTLNRVDQTNDTNTYDVAGTSLSFSDQLRRRAFNSTIQVRNHI